MNNQTETLQTKCSDWCCARNAEMARQDEFNNSEKQFSSSELPDVEKRTKEFTKRSSIFVIN